jgi:hypothetical protein
VLSLLQGAELCGEVYRLKVQYEISQPLVVPCRKRGFGSNRSRPRIFWGAKQVPRSLTSAAADTEV